MNEPWVSIGHSHVKAIAESGVADIDCINFWDLDDPWAPGEAGRRLCEVTEAYRQRRGMMFVRPPANVTDEDGFPQPEFDVDGAHADGAYGDLVLEALGRKP